MVNASDADESGSEAQVRARLVALQQQVGAIAAELSALADEVEGAGASADTAADVQATANVAAETPASATATGQAETANTPESSPEPVGFEPIDQPILPKYPAPSPEPTAAPNAPEYVGLEYAGPEYAGSEYAVPAPAAGSHPVSGHLPPGYPPPGPAASSYGPPGYPAPSYAAPAYPAPGPGYYPPVAPMPSTATPATEKDAGSWADRSGFKVLGWAGGGVTIIGIVWLLVVAVQEGLIDPTVRVIIGAALGVALVLIGLVTHGSPRRAPLAVTLVCTGLAVAYLSVIGATKLVPPPLPIVGFGATALVAAVAIWISLAWRHEWLAGIAFLITGFLAPLVAKDLTDSVFVFELILVAAGAALLLLAHQHAAWWGASIPAFFFFLVTAIDEQQTPTMMWLLIVFVLFAWVLMIGRWATGRAIVDPGPFPLRQRTPDPQQTARDYADYHAHTRQQQRARLDHFLATATLTATAPLLVVSLAMIDTLWPRDMAAAYLTGALAVLFVALAFIAFRHTDLIATVTPTAAWSTGLALAALAFFYGFGANSAPLAWIVAAAAALLTAGMTRSGRLLIPASIGAFFAVLATDSIVNIGSLLRVPPPLPADLVDGSQLASRALTEVLPTGIVLIVTAAVFGWAVTRAIQAHAATTATPLEYPAGAPVRVAADSRNPIITLLLFIGLLVGCYGLYATVMVIAYAVSLSSNGYQGGQITMTILITVLGVVLLWQGFRSMLWRIGGLVAVGVAVAKLLFFDTTSLASIPRAMTFIGVGLLLLLGAAVYLRTLGRIEKTAQNASEQVGNPSENHPNNRDVPIVGAEHS